MKQEENPTLSQEVERDSPLKEWIVGYVGEKTQPEDDQVTVEMIVETMAEEFPDFLIAVAEENFIRGYFQAMNDVGESEKAMSEAENNE